MKVDKTSEYKNTIVGRLVEEAVMTVPDGEDNDEYVGADDMYVEEKDGSASYGSVSSALCCSGEISDGDDADDNCSTILNL
jgi:hypothetical protein